MLRVTRVGCDPGIYPCGPDAERGVGRVVIAMDQIMDQTGVFAMVDPGLFENAGRTHVRRDVTPGMSSAKNGQSVKCRGVHIERIFCMKRGHCRLIAQIALELSALTIKDLDR